VLAAEPPRILLNGATGSGKTEQIGLRLPAMVAFDRDVRQRPHRVIIAFPDHSPGAKVAERYRALAEDAGRGEIKIAVLEGRGEPSPTKHNPWREYLCRNLDEVDLARQAGVRDVGKAVCGRVAARRAAHSPGRARGPQLRAG